MIRLVLVLQLRSVLGRLDRDLARQIFNIICIYQDIILGLLVQCLHLDLFLKLKDALSPFVFANSTDLVYVLRLLIILDALRVNVGGRHHFGVSVHASHVDVRQE